MLIICGFHANVTVVLNKDVFRYFGIVFSFNKHRSFCVKAYAQNFKASQNFSLKPAFVYMHPYTLAQLYHSRHIRKRHPITIGFNPVAYRRFSGAGNIEVYITDVLPQSIAPYHFPVKARKASQIPFVIYL